MGNRLSKIYTRTGDDGTTGMADGSRVSKSDLLFEAMGDIDELNANIGMVRALLVNNELAFTEVADKEALGEYQRSYDGTLSIIQHLLFNVGGELAMPGYQGVTETHIEWLEIDIGNMNKILPNLKEFILPAGSVLAAQVHIARTVCRRAERKTVKLTESQPDALSLISRKFINRLSDWLFVFSREVLRMAGVSEVLWQKEV